MLGAHYYPWYGRHVHSILGGGDWTSGYTNHPTLGEYDSKEPKVINQHITQAKSAGIDFFTIEWTGQHTLEDFTLKNYYLSASEASKIKFCIFYDSFFTLNKFGTQLSYNFNNNYITAKTKGQKFIEDFEYLADTYFDNPQYLKINNRPLVLIYIARVFQNASCYFERLKDIMSEKGFSPFLVGDIVYWVSINLSKESLLIFLRQPSINMIKGFYRGVRNSLPLNNLEKDIPHIKYFDAITGYNMYATDRILNFLKNVDAEYRKFYNYALLNKLHFIPTIMPGYDDRNLKGLTRPILERRNGEFYKEYWDISKKYIDPELRMVFITSFNEWHEGTEIEQSEEYESTYLEYTKLFSDELKGRVRII